MTRTPDGKSASRRGEMASLAWDCGDPHRRPYRLKPNEQAQAHDLLQLMGRRGVRKVFTGFQMED